MSESDIQGRAKQGGRAERERQSGDSLRARPADLCGLVGEHLSSYVDGQAGLLAKGMIEDHLLECGPCRRAAAAEAELLQATVEHLVAVEPPPGLALRLRQKVDRAREVETAVMRRRKLVRRVAAVLQIALLLGGTGGFVAWNLTPLDLNARPRLAASDTPSADGSDFDAFDAGSVAGTNGALAALAPLRGDLDGNGVFNHSDIQLLGGHVQGSKGPVPCLRAADINGDQMVDLVDFIGCVQLLCQPEASASIAAVDLSSSELPCDDLLCLTTH